jgi:hypothetical protein
MGKYAAISTGDPEILADLIAAMREPTIAELAEQVRSLRAEVAALREQQPPRSDFLAVGPEVVEAFRRLERHAKPTNLGTP